MALISPMLMILFAGIIDFGRVYHEEIELSAAVAAAAQYALLNAASINSTSAASLAATLSGIVANANGAAWADATVTVNDGATKAVTGGSTTSSGTAANANSCWCPTGTAAARTGARRGTCGSSLRRRHVGRQVRHHQRHAAIFGDFHDLRLDEQHQSASKHDRAGAMKSPAGVAPLGLRRDRRATTAVEFAICGWRWC